MGQAEQRVDARKGAALMTSSGQGATAATTATHSYERQVVCCCVSAAVRAVGAWRCSRAGSTCGSAGGGGSGGGWAVFLQQAAQCFTEHL